MTGGKAQVERGSSPGDLRVVKVLKRVIQHPKTRLAVVGVAVVAVSIKTFCIVYLIVTYDQPIGISTENIKYTPCDSHPRTKGTNSGTIGLTMMSKLAQPASRRQRRLNGHHQIILVLEGRISTDDVLKEAARFRPAEHNS